MPLITRYMTTDGPRFGIVEDGMIYSLSTDPFLTPTLQGEDLMGPAEDLLLAPPVTPTKIICIGRNYVGHAQEHSVPVPENPMLFFKPPSALTGYDTPIVLPPDVGRVDLEAELAVVIGKQARKISRDNALDYVFGYTCANDVSARALQKADGQWGRAKGFDTFCPLGPWINTDIENPNNLNIRARLNNDTVIDSNTSYMVFDVPYLIEFISRVMTLEVGDVILTGTPEGVSQINDGDKVEIEIEGIGTLRNWVEIEPAN
ncbi:MAG: fumarylacetoacetate hydrolase family protein [Chloroflexi bacterium]|nr:fumarylacetoacetate hydrolase family protein [Chloroflexota bacterium]